MNKITIAIVAALIIASCQDMGHIREVRDKCPCYVHVDFSYVGEDVETIDLWMQNSEYETFDYYGHFSRPYPDTVYVPVTRGTVNLYSWGNLGGAKTIDSLMEIHFYPVPEIMYPYTEIFDANCDNLTVKLYPSKKGIRLITNVLSDIGPVSVMKVSATTSKGYKYGGEYINAPLTYNLMPSDDDPMMFDGFLPMQDTYGPLSLAIEYENGGMGWNTDFDLAEYLINEGIDLKNSEAIAVTVLLTGTVGTIEIQPVKVYQYDITL